MTGDASGTPAGVLSLAVLGPLDLRAAGEPIAPPPRHVRWLLAVLLLHDGEYVPDDDLIGRAWGPDGVSTGALRTAISRLRTWLAPHGCGVVHGGNGYRLLVPPMSVDAARFRRYVAQAARADDPGSAGELLRAALAEWRDGVLAGAPDPVRADPEAFRLEAARRDCGRRLGELALAAGTPESAVPYLAELAAANGHDEPLHAVHLRVLAAAGRPAEALLTHRRLSRRLREDLGVDPSEDVQRAYQSVLALDRPAGPEPARGSAPARRSERRPGGPAQLPPTTPDFTGREAELDRLHELADTGDRGAGPVVIAGAAGIGKTALALRWGYEVEDGYPDGQLYLDLRGFGPGEPVRPAEALPRLLRGLGVEPARVPGDVDEAAALYRTSLAGRRVLVLLDNAASAEQVRPLLPGSAACQVVVTSRDGLAGLIARDGARRLTLEVLDPADAVALLRRIVGADRLAREPEAAADLVELCGRLPLAVRIAAAQLAGEPDRRIADLAAQLRRGGPLAALAIDGDERSAVGAAFAASYGVLPPATRRLFRLLGLVPGADFAAGAAGALAAVPAAEAASLLDELAAAHLLEPNPDGRYGFHSLIRLYARERAEAEESMAARLDAMRRLLTWYLVVLHAANAVLTPHRARIPPPADRAAVVPPFAPTHGDVLAFVDREVLNLAPVVRFAGESGFDAVAWQLCYLLGGYFELRRPVAEFLECCRWGLAAAQRLGDAEAEGTVRNLIGMVHVSTRRFPDAIRELTRAAAVMRSIGDTRGEANAYSNIGIAYSFQRDFAAAVRYWERTLASYEAAGYRSEAAIVLDNLGQDYLQLGRIDRSFACLQRSLATWRELGNRQGEGIALYSLGRTRLAAGDPRSAIETLEQALDVLREAGDLMHECHTLEELGHARLALGDHPAALDYFHRARELSRKLDDQHGEAAMLTRIAQAKMHHGDLAGARDYLADARALRAHRPDVYEQARLDHYEGDLEQLSGSPRAAVEHWTRALRGYHRLGAGEADDIRRKLAGARGQSS